MATSDDDNTSTAYARSFAADEDVGWEWERDLEAQGHGGCWEKSHLEAAFDDVDESGPSRRTAGQSGPGCRRADVRIYEDVCDLLTDHPVVDATEVVVEVANGVVVLRGSVATHRELVLCRDIVESVRGVASYDLRVRVAPPSASSDAAGDGVDAHGGGDGAGR